MGRIWQAMKGHLYVGTREKHSRQTGDEDLFRGREPTQMGWYEFAASLAPGRTVLDVGCGSGEGLKVLSAAARQAVGIDLDERLKRPDLDIQVKDISEIPDQSFDLVVCIDVLEHIQDDRGFVKQLARITRGVLFVSTPNYAVSRNAHPYHVREYTPYEFARLFSRWGRVRFFGGSSTGATHTEIGNRFIYYLLSALYSLKLTVLAAKVLRRLLFVRVWPHQAVIVTVGAR